MRLAETCTSGPGRGESLKFAMHVSRLAVGILVSLLGAGCETVSGRADPITPRGYIDSTRPVYVHTVTSAPGHLRMLGYVSAKGTGHDANVALVMAELIRQAQHLGATHLVVDQLETHYRLVQTTSMFMFRCGYMMTCASMYPNTFESPELIAHGRALGPAAPQQDVSP